MAVREGWDMSRQRKADLLLVLATGFWGVSYFLLDLCLTELPPLTLNAFRFFDSVFRAGGHLLPEAAGHLPADAACQHPHRAVPGADVHRLHLWCAVYLSLQRRLYLRSAGGGDAAAGVAVSAEAVIAFVCAASLAAISWRVSPLSTSKSTEMKSEEI